MRTLKAGDVGFTFKPKNWFSRLIYAVSLWRTNPKSALKVSHCFICLDDGMIAEATFTGIAIVNFKKYADGKHDVYFKTPEKPLDYYQQVRGLEFVRASAGIVKYGFLALIAVLLNKWFRYRVFGYSRKEMFCSQFVVNYYAAIGLSLTPKEPEGSTPLDVLESPLLVDL